MIGTSRISLKQERPVGGFDREPLIEVTELSKAFAGIRALDRVTLTVCRGEILALLGHNGSGKSTLVKCLSGAYQADSGRIDLKSGDVKLHFIHQSLALVSSLSVAENLSLGQSAPHLGLRRISRKSEHRRVADLLSGLGSTIEPDARLSDLTQAERTIVAIARALQNWDRPDNILVLDEPTATLHGEEVETLLGIVRHIADSGAGVIYISHRLAEVERIADTAVVMKAGCVVARTSRGEFDAKSLAAIVAGGAANPPAERAEKPFGPVALRVNGLRSRTIQNLDLDLHRGEILGIAGLVGSGMEELCAMVFGAATPQAGRILVGGKSIAPGNPGAAIAAGCAYIPADRLRYGGFAALTARENISLPRLGPLTRFGAIDRRAERRQAEEWMTTLSVKPEHAGEKRLDSFSGGNQQKIVLAKWLRTNPAVFLIDEPTQGVDVGAQAAIHGLLAAAAEQGMAIVLSSSDTRELATFCHRVIIMVDGRLETSFSGSSMTEAALINAMLSGSRHTAHSREPT